MSYRATSVSDDIQSLKTDEELSKMKFPKKFSEKVELRKVNSKVINRWIEDRLEELIPDDDIIVGFVQELVFGVDGGDVTTLNSDSSLKKIDPRFIQLQLIPFLDDKASEFTKELWDLLLEAQTSDDGIPSSLPDKYKPNKVMEKIIPQKRTIGRERERPNTFRYNKDDRHRNNDYSKDRYQSDYKSYSREGSGGYRRARQSYNNKGASHHNENRAPKNDSKYRNRNYKDEKRAHADKDARLNNESHN